MKKISIILLMAVVCSLQKTATAQVKTITTSAVPKPIADQSNLKAIYEQGGEPVPPVESWTSKQIALYNNEGFWFERNIAIAYTKAGLYGAIDENKNWVIKPTYKFLYRLKGELDGSLIAKVGIKYGVIGYSGRKIIDTKYDWISEDSEKGKLVVKLNKKFGVIDELDETIIPITYDSISVKGMLNEGLLAVKLNGKWGFVDSTNKKVVDFMYDAAENFYAKRALIKQKGKYGFIDPSGAVKIAIRYLSATSFDDGEDMEYAVVNLTKNEEQEIVIDVNGDVRKDEE